jgi:Asp-tRNA(Asn)/Glu-tRNA(Gln) amidotransferase B subunit
MEAKRRITLFCEIMNELIYINIINEFMINNPKLVQQYIESKDKEREEVFHFCMQQIMKSGRGHANPALLSRMLKSKLNNSI